MRIKLIHSLILDIVSVKQSMDVIFVSQSSNQLISTCQILIESDSELALISRLFYPLIFSEIMTLISICSNC